MSMRNNPVSVVHNVDKETLLTPELRQAIDAYIARYPDAWKQSAVMPALTLVQEANGGWLTQALMDQVAAYLDMPYVAVYEVASFYSMYDHEPQGRHKVCVCNSISCMLRGSDALLEHMKQKHGLGVGDTSEDGRFTVKTVECLGACRDAPVVLIDKVYHENVTPEKLDDLVKELK